VPDHQQPPVDRQPPNRLKRLRRFKALRQRLIQLQAPALRLAPALRREFCCLSRAYPWAEQNDVEGRAHPRERNARRARLQSPTLGQAALGVRAGAVRLGLSVTK